MSKASIIREIKSAGYSVSSLLSVNADSKTVKGLKKGYLTGVMYLMPDDELCPMSELAGCRAACLVTAGRAAFTPGIGYARAERTRLFKARSDLFMALLVEEISALVRKAKRLNLTPAVRLNGTSDIDWTTVKTYDRTLFELFPEIQFYDYTKRPNIIRKAATVNNWHITASYSEANNKYKDLIMHAADGFGANLAVVFRGALPAFYNGKRVIPGDDTDLRFADPAGVVVGLTAKGKAKQDTTGFVIAVQS